MMIKTKRKKRRRKKIKTGRAQILITPMGGDGTKNIPHSPLLSLITVVAVEA